MVDYLQWLSDNNTMLRYRRQHKVEHSWEKSVNQYWQYQAQAVKLAQEIGGHKAAQELGIPKGTMYTWIKAFKEGRLSANEAVHTPKNALSLNDELIELRKRVKEQDKEIRRLKEENEFLEEASAFFAASRRKSVKNRD